MKYQEIKGQLKVGEKIIIKEQKIVEQMYEVVSGYTNGTFCFRTLGTGIPTKIDESFLDENCEVEIVPEKVVINGNVYLKNEVMEKIKELKPQV